MQCELTIHSHACRPILKLQKGIVRPNYFSLLYTFVNTVRYPQVPDFLKVHTFYSTVTFSKVVTTI